MDDSFNLNTWVTAFNSHLKLRAFEQFSLLLCDVQKCSTLQRDLLHKLLFDDHRSPELWFAYIDFVVKTNPDRRLQLQRLVNKSLELLDEKDCKDNKSFLSIHIISAQLKGDAKDSIKYFQNTIWKKEIGRRFATLYLTWAKYETDLNGKASALDILQKGLLCGAEPRQLLITCVQDLNNVSNHTNSPENIILKEEDDEEIEFKSGAEGSRRGVFVVSVSSGDEDATATIKLDIPPPSRHKKPTLHSHSNKQMPDNSIMPDAKHGTKKYKHKFKAIKAFAATKNNKFVVREMSARDSST